VHTRGSVWCIYLFAGGTNPLSAVAPLCAFALTFAVTRWSLSGRRDVPLRRDNPAPIRRVRA